MKRLIICLYLLVIGAFTFVHAARMDTTNVSSPKVLIINSYRVETDWSKMMIETITDKLTRQYPDVYIHVGYMNLNMHTLPANPLYTLRSILWSFANADSDVVNAEDDRLKTLFASEECPDVLLFIGSDALLFYQNFGPFLGKWRDVPIVVCGVPESIIDGEYELGKLISFDHLVPVEKRRTVNNFIAEKDKALTDGFELVKHIQDNIKGYQITVNYNLTGVKGSFLIRENLELIRHLIPDLKDIVWVDNDFYSSNYALWTLKEEMPAIFPDADLVEIKQNRFNTDSIYNEILKPVSQKAYLTYSWDLNGLYSRQNDEQVRTLFNNYSSMPLFSLTPRFSSDPYWIGGFYRPYEELADKTVKLACRILQGESANAIPFETVTGGHIVLDRPLLDKYNLARRAKSLENVEYVNVPPSFYEENERFILANIIIGAIVLGLLAYWIRRRRYNRALREEYIRYMKLHNKLYLIYRHTAIDLALYDKNGKLIVSIIKGKEHDSKEAKNELFSENIFENPSLSKSLKEEIQNRQPVNREITVYSDGPLSSVDSERKVYQFIVKPLDAENSRSASYVAIAINLNQVIREREARERFEILVRFASDSSQMGIAFYDVDTAIGTATNSWYQNLNEPIAPGLLPAYDHVVEEDRLLLLDFRKKIQDGDTTSTFHKDIRVMGEDGKEHWITQHVFSHESNRKMLIELNLNIDEQKQTENNLRKAKAKVERSIRETQDFLANINHEIRTPLNSIVGFSAILAASESEEERKEHVSLILKNNRLLTMLIDDVIELSKIDAGQTTFVQEPVKMEELFSKVIMAGHSELYNKQLDIILDLDKGCPIVNTDKEAIYRLLNNLLSNAIKFTQEGSVTLGYRKEENQYYFFVKDTGCGIASENQERIFKRFIKLDLYMQGTGLGLALCKSIVEHLGGRMGVESELGKGSTFWFTLPVENDASENV